MDKQRVFVSYSVSDESWVREFTNSLRRQGFEVVLDYHDLELGSSLANALEEGLRKSSVIVLLVTPDSVRKPNFFFEMGAAIGMGKRLVPVISSEVDPSDLPAPLRERQYLVKATPEATAQEFASHAAAV
jgi:predicted nucleotide-binding protein